MYRLAPHCFQLKFIPTTAARRVTLVCLCGVLLAWLGAPGHAGDLQRPNIIFAIADDWSFGHASAYGCNWVDTPSFDRVARDGLLFTRAYTPNAKCAPSRATILTGRNSWQLKDACNHVCNFPSEFRSWPEALRALGYVTGSTGKTWGPGIALDADGNRRQMAGEPFNAKRTNPPARAISNIDYAANFAAFLEQANDEQPWCFWYGTLEPHRAYQYEAGRELSGKSLDQIRHVPAFWPDNSTIRNDMLDYAFEVEYFDQHLGRILQTLETHDELANTLVIVTSDHGMPFPRCKGQAYDYSNHVPLAVMWPSTIENPGRTIDDYISFADIAATVIEAAGFSWEDTDMQPTVGNSWLSLMRSSRAGHVEPVRNHVLLGKERHDTGRPDDQGYPIRAIVQHDWLYIHNYETERWPACDPVTGYLNCDGSPTKTFVLNLRRNDRDARFWQLCFGKRPTEELYDLESDPDCVNNLASVPKHQQRLQRMRSFMESQLHQQQDPRMKGNGDYFDSIPYVNEANRDFYNRFMAGEDVRAGWVNPSDFEKREEQP